MRTHLSVMEKGFSHTIYCMEIDENKILTLNKILTDKVKFGFLFGSVITSYFTEKSDIDIAIWLNDFPLSVDEFVEIKYILQKSIDFKHEIDLVILNNANIIIINQVLTKGKLWIDNDSIFLQNFINSRTGMYFDFKRWRKNLEENIIAT